MYTQFSQLSFLKGLFISLSHCPGTFVENQFIENLRVYFWILNSVSLVCMSIFVPVPHCLDYHGFIVALKSGSLSSPALFIFKSAWLFCINFRINLSVSAKKDSSIGIGLNLDQFRENCYFNNIVFLSMKMECLFIYAFFEFFKHVFSLSVQSYFIIYS